MKTSSVYSPIFFVGTYVLAMLWIFPGISKNFNFCLAPNHPANLLGLLAGVCGMVTLYYYGKHERGGIRAMGIITFLFGMLVLGIVIYRFLLIPAPYCSI